MATKLARTTTLVDLPTELICEILGYVLPEDIENFAGTCRTTASAAQPTLKVHRNLIRKYAIFKNDGLVEGSMGQLAEEVAVDRIGRYVICLECSGFRHTSLWQCEDDERTLTGLLHFLPNLRTFTLDWPRGDLSQLEGAVADAPHMAEPTFTRLEAVHLKCNGLDDHDGVQLDLMQAFCALPSMRQLSVTHSGIEQRMRGPINSRNSNVIKLDLCNCSIPFDDLRIYLQGFTQLQSFTYWERAVPWHRFRRTTLITEGLLNSKLTLRKLVMVADQLSKIGSLTDFQALEELETHVDLLPFLHLGENGVPSLHLPDSLQVLKLLSHTSKPSKYEYIINVAIARKSSTNCQLREMMIAFFSSPMIKSKPRLTVETRKDDELRARCKSVGITLSFFYDGWPTGPWKTSNL